ncbi:MAG: hypothetical protein QF685_05985 [Verrucomicrobiota bacterium]|nr:hypothetical protein [Verrucomicrobiota bacterium]
MSLELNSIGTPHNAALQGVKSRQAQLQVGGYPMVSKLPDSTPSVADTSLTASQAIREFMMAAQSAAVAVGSTDPMKPFVEGIAQDLSRANGDVFSAMGQMNDLQNALSFALEANAGLRANPALQAIA